VALTFNSITNIDGEHGPVLDNIVLTDTPGSVGTGAPEPASWMFTLIGLGLAGAGARRRVRIWKDGGL
jgi:MYXO-CTERM domain-containing protein